MPRYHETYPLLELLENIARESGQMVHVQSQEERDPVYLDPERPLPESLARPLRELGIERLGDGDPQPASFARLTPARLVHPGGGGGAAHLDAELPLDRCCRQVLAELTPEK